MGKRSFIGDILEQPKVLLDSISKYPHESVDCLLTKIRNGEIDRIILAGHGSSYNALYPAFLRLCHLPIPVSIWQTAELLNYGMSQIGSRTLLCLNSQSGRSIEVERLVSSLSNSRPASIIVFTNYVNSPLGKAADVIIPLLAGEEHGVATKTYLNPLCLSTLFSIQICGGDFEAIRSEYVDLCDVIKEYLSDWEKKVKEFTEILGIFEQIFVIGRGPSMASALNGALNQKESSWSFTEGMNAAEFRHGPLELADEKLTLIIMEGDSKTKEHNKTLAKEVQSYGSKVIWIGNHADEGILSINIPKTSETVQPAAEIIPLQLIAQAIANIKGIEAGKFRRIGKVVLTE